MELNICHLYPDVLNLYGDRGNVICMKKRLQWRGIDVNIKKIGLGSDMKLSGCDLIFMGGGQEFELQLLQEDLKNGRAEELRAAAEDGTVFLSICSGFQLLGNYCETTDGVRTDCTGILDMYTKASGKRFTGNYDFACTQECGGSTVVGFENHCGMTWLSDGLQPLGRVLHGSGNNGSDGTEGARYKNVFGTYSYGPLLPKNPQFCDLILKTALDRRYGSAELVPLNDSAELEAHDEIISKL